MAGCTEGRVWRIVVRAAKAHSDYMKNHAAEIFPSGNSKQLLTTVYAEAFPKLISQSDGGAWALAGTAPRKVELDRTAIWSKPFPTASRS